MKGPDQLLESLERMNAITEGLGGAAASSKADDGKFAEVLTNSVDKINGEMVHADQMSKEFLTEGKHDLHEVMIALERADLSFRYMMQVRNKVLDAYQEIIRLQV